MTLGDFEILPGIVIKNDDPAGLYRVKACAPTLFDNSTMDSEDFMWISPFMMFGNQAFSKQEIGSKIWILHNTNNYFEYWYFPMFDMNNNFPQLNTDDNVIMSRSINGELVQIYYSRDEGFNIKCGDNHIVQSPDGSFYVKSGKANIEANDENIKLTQNESNEYSAVKAEELIKVLTSFSSNLMSIAGIMGSNPYTAQIASPLIDTAFELQNNLSSIKSDFVKIS